MAGSRGRLTLTPGDVIFCSQGRQGLHELHLYRRGQSPHGQLMVSANLTHKVPSQPHARLCRATHLRYRQASRIEENGFLCVEPFQSPQGAVSCRVGEFSRRLTTAIFIAGSRDRTADRTYGEMRRQDRAGETQALRSWTSWAQQDCGT